MDCKIKKARLAAGLTQAELSRRFEIPLGTLAHWEKGDRTPPVWAEKLLIDAINRIKPILLTYLSRKVKIKDFDS